MEMTGPHFQSSQENFDVRHVHRVSCDEDKTQAIQWLDY